MVCVNFESSEEFKEQVLVCRESTKSNKSFRRRRYSCAQKVQHDMPLEIKKGLSQDKGQLPMNVLALQASCITTCIFQESTRGCQNN